MNIWNTENFIKHATEKTRKLIYENKVRQKDGSESFMNLSVGVQKIREGLFAYHMESKLFNRVVVRIKK